MHSICSIHVCDNHSYQADNVLIRLLTTKRNVIRNGVLGDFGFAKLVDEVQSKSAIGSGFKGSNFT